jgi:hypothetical protein
MWSLAVWGKPTKVLEEFLNTQRCLFRHVDGGNSPFEALVNVSKILWRHIAEESLLRSNRLEVTKPHISCIN